MLPDLHNFPNVSVPQKNLPKTCVDTFALAESRFLFPFIYGICFALPIVVLAGLVAYQVRFLSKVLNALQSADVWMKNIVGILFIVLGIYLTIRYNFS